MLIASVAHQVVSRIDIAHNAIRPEDDVAELMLNDKGVIRECSPSAARLLGCLASSLVWQHISVLLPQLKEKTLMKAGQINPKLHFLSRIGRTFDVIRGDGVSFASELFFNVVENNGRTQLRIQLRPSSRYPGI